MAAEISQNLTALRGLAAYMHWSTYRQVSNIRRTLVVNKNVDHSDVVGASPVGAAPTYIFILDLTSGFIGLGKDSCKMRRETFKFGDLVRLILEILRYFYHLPKATTSPGVDTHVHPPELIGHTKVPR